jgi:hypothetical protein
LGCFTWAPIVDKKTTHLGTDTVRALLNATVLAFSSANPDADRDSAAAEERQRLPPQTQRAKATGSLISATTRSQP